jgi:glycine/D-amino acid oxidase-like deaminating enzyme
VTFAQPRHCVVIGAGVLGAAVAARLAGSGVRVTLLDQDQPGRATSRRSFAWLNSNDKSPRPYHELNHAGIRAWAKLAPDLDGTAWYRPVGNIELATSPAARAELTSRVRRLTGWNYDARLIDPAEATELEPALRLPEPGLLEPGLLEPAVLAAWFPDEGYLLTEPLIARLVARAKSLGAEVLTGDQGRVVALEASPGTPLRVGTAAGAVLTGDDVICCAGRWTPGLVALARPAGAPDLVPLVPWESAGATAPGLVVQVGPVSSLAPARLVHAPGICLRPHSGGLLHLEAPDAAVDLHTPDPVLRRWAAELLRRAQHAVRGLEGARVTGYHVCVRPMPADGQSIVGRLPGAPGLYVAVTHSGVTLAAHLAELITAELTTAELTTAELTTAELTTAELTTAELTTAELTTGTVPMAPEPPAVSAALAPYRPGRFTPSAVHARNRDDAPEPG